MNVWVGALSGLVAGVTISLCLVLHHAAVAAEVKPKEMELRLLRQRDEERARRLHLIDLRLAALEKAR